MREHDALIGQYTHEQNRPRADAALNMLRKIASMVKPIMRQRGWRVGKLSEFYPEQQNLLGLNYNHGQRICIRLRYPNDQTLFLPLEQVIDTMLHELAHNVFGPHDEKFHNLWNELRDEYEALIRKGYTGEGFLSNGQRLGGGGSKPIHQARRLARAAAENRQKQSTSGPKRVGGAAPSDMVDIRKTIADAAQRRRDILKGCGSTDTDHRWKDKVLEETIRNEVQTAPEIDDADMRAIEQAFMEMIQEDEERQNRSDRSLFQTRNPLDNGDFGSAAASLLPSAETMRPPPIPTNSKPLTTPLPSSALVQGGRYTSSSPDPQIPPRSTWTCEICTFENPETFLCCDVCLIERPSAQPIPELAILRPQSSARANTAPPGDHRLLRSRSSASNVARFTEAEAKAANSKPIAWSCHQCGNYMESQWWTCSQCGAMKLKS